MVIKTKKYKLEHQKYIMLALKNALREFWWAWLIPVGIMLIPIFYAPAFWWCFGISLTAIILYLLFWLVQFAGITQHEQGKIFFEKLSYEITSKNIMMKVSANKGMPIKWEQIKGAKKGKDHFLFIVSRVQIIYLPFELFKSESEIKFVEAILKRKNFLSAA